MSQPPEGAFIPTQQIYEQLVGLRQRVQRLEDRLEDAISKDIADVEQAYRDQQAALIVAAAEHEKRHRGLDVKFYSVLAGLIAALGVVATGWPR